MSVMKNVEISLKEICRKHIIRVFIYVIKVHLYGGNQYRGNADATKVREKNG